VVVPPQNTGVGVRFVFVVIFLAALFPLAIIGEIWSGMFRC
jgi:hypothetical protein